MTLCYVGKKIQLLGYVNSNFAGDVNCRNSTTGYVFTLRSRAVSYVSSLQKIVALSTMEVEYVVTTEACKELISLKNFFKELGKELCIVTARA